MASAVGEFIEAGVDGAHRQLLGYAIVGLAEITARQWVARNGGLGAAPTTTPLDAAEGDLLAERLANLVWAGLRSLPGPGPQHPGQQHPGGWPPRAERRPDTLPGHGRPADRAPGKVQIPPNCDVTLGMTCVDKSQPGVTVWEMAAEERFANPVGVHPGRFPRRVRRFRHGGHVGHRQPGAQGVHRQHRPEDQLLPGGSHRDRLTCTARPCPPAGG